MGSTRTVAAAASVLLLAGCGIDDSTAETIQPPVAAYEPPEGWDEQGMADGDYPEYGDPPIFHSGSFCTTDGCVRAVRQFFLETAVPEPAEVAASADRFAAAGGWEVVYRPDCTVDGDDVVDLRLDSPRCEWEVDTGDAFTIIELDASSVSGLWQVDVSAYLDDHFRRSSISPQVEQARLANSERLRAVADRAKVPQHWGERHEAVVSDPTDCVRTDCLTVVHDWVGVEQTSADEVTAVAASTGLPVTQAAEDCTVDPEQSNVPYATCTATAEGDGLRATVEITGYPQTGGITAELAVSTSDG